MARKRTNGTHGSTDDWRHQLEAVLRDIPGYDPWAHAKACGAWLDHEAAMAAVNFFAERLKHVEGAARAQPFTLRRWQAAIVGNLFGWKRRDEKDRIVRRYRKAFIKVGRGNGKTPLASGIVLLGYFTDDEPGAQCYLAAGQREQAGILFRNARGMIEQDADMESAVRIYGGKNPGSPRSIVKNEDPLAFVKVIPADAAGQHGGIPHITVVDEVHAQQSRDLLDVFETAMSKQVRKQPLLVMITTADFDRPSICNEIDAYAHKVRDNGGDPAKTGHDPEFLPVLYELEPEEDWRDETLWIKANPNLGVSVSLESLRKASHKAAEQPAFENAFRRLHCNQKTSQNVRIIPMLNWRDCGRDLREKQLPLFPPDDQLLSVPCYAGMDLASTEDLASYCLVFALPEDYLAVIWRTFCPEDKIQSRARQRIPYDLWHKAGHLIATTGNQIDYRVIEETFLADAEKYRPVELGLDPHGATHIGQRLAEKLGESFVVTVPQTMANLSAPFKDIIRLVKLHKLLHNHDPVAEWAAGNVAGYFQGRIPEGGKLEDHLDKVPVMPSKQKSADKIDPIAALVIARARMLANPPVGPSVYETRGILTL